VNEHLKFTFAPSFSTRKQLNLSLKNIINGISQIIILKGKESEFWFSKILHCEKKRQGSVVGLATRLWAWLSGVWIPLGAGRFYLLQHDWLWGPPTALLGEYRSFFPRGEAAWAWELLTSFYCWG
jgi:hypothetical protein